MKRKKKKQKAQKDDGLLHGKDRIVCVKCGYEQEFRSFEEISTVALDTPCPECGFLYIQAAHDKMEALFEMLEEVSFLDEKEIQRKFDNFCEEYDKKHQ